MNRRHLTGPRQGSQHSSGTTTSEGTGDTQFDDDLAEALRRSKVEYLQEYELRSLREGVESRLSDLAVSYYASEHSTKQIEDSTKRCQETGISQTRGRSTDSRELDNSRSERYRLILRDLQSLDRSVDELYAPLPAARFDIGSLKKKQSDMNTRLITSRNKIQKQLDTDRLLLERGYRILETDSSVLKSVMKSMRSSLSGKIARSTDHRDLKSMQSGRRRDSIWSEISSSVSTHPEKLSSSRLI